MGIVGPTLVAAAGELFSRRMEVSGELRPQRLANAMGTVLKVPEEVAQEQEDVS